MQGGRKEGRQEGRKDLFSGLLDFYYGQIADSR